MTSQISRRSVAKGAAWSIPAVAIASAAPAVAASVVTPTASLSVGMTDLRLLSTTNPNDAGRFYLDFEVNSPTPVPAGTTFTMKFFDTSDSGKSFEAFEYLDSQWATVENSKLAIGDPPRGGGASTYTQYLTVTTLVPWTQGNYSISVQRSDLHTKTCLETVVSVNPSTLEVDGTTVNIVINNRRSISAVA